ncbi:hypothetical protein KPH14_009656 [Odynerus spinipes]|uniref:Rho-GAP domain-containing protein n=1 Tax=Odynerus spinipes TaxID=1348599 RepID=A0AAD9RQ60_9HYME|nr:hypothetical protein KPH14_009656 [Odynerus spinipes]
MCESFYSILVENSKIVPTSSMLIYDVLHKEKVYEIVINDLRNIGIKYRFKKNAIKTEKFEKSKNVSKKVFRTPLSYQPLDVVNLSSGGIVHVPVFVSQASAFLEKHITQEGLFRKAGSHIRQKELMALLDKGSSLGEKNHAIDVANCLKTFFRDLPEPLIPYTYHDLFLHCVMLKKHHVQALLLACVLLPPYHLSTLAFIMEFLKKVSIYEKQNKMSIDNLAKVIGPNIMPLREATMIAVQSRLELHLVIVKVLIENAENIGVLPDHVTHAMLSEVIGSIDNELDLSDSHLHGKLKKKKYRSGSLTRKPHLSASNLNLRMLHGLKKIVGKGNSPINVDTNENQDSITNSNVMFTSSKSTKKRKVIDWLDPQSTKKKRVSDKMEKSKKTGLGIDRFVSRNKQKTDSKSSILAFSPYTERRWSLAHDSPVSYQKRRTNSDGSLHLKKSILKETETPNSKNHNNYNDVFVDADINLSDDNCEQVLLKKEDNTDVNQWHIKYNKSAEKLKHTNKHSEIPIKKSVKKEESEEYVRIPKSEYEEIKNRVSAIESRISQEFGYIDDVRNESLVEHSVNKVQTEYEKTLEEAGIKNIVTADHLARKLGKELKIRRSSERKVIRSPSARKIGSLRRRSQEKVKSKRVSRTASWHTSQEWQQKYRNQPNEQEVLCFADVESDMPIKITKQVSSSDLRSDTVCSAETNARLELLQKQLNALISHTTEHTRDSLSDDESSTNDINIHTPIQSPLKLSVRRASSFHGNEFINNSFYFNRKVKELKKTNSQQNVILNNEYQDKQNNMPQNWKETSISWKDAGDYFKSTVQIRTPVPQTGRASVAKLRTQNAGMVLAKAKLFDENTIKVSACMFDNSQNQKDCIVNINKKGTGSEQIDNINLEYCDLESKHNISVRKKLERHARNKELSRLQSPKISSTNKDNSMDVSLEINEDELDKHCNRRHSQKYNQNLSKGNRQMHKAYYTNEKKDRESKFSDQQKENIIVRTPSILKNTSVKKVDEIPNLNIYKLENGICKTPHIKRPLAVKTPKSSKSLMRRPPIDTRRTPLKAIAQLETTKYQSPKRILKTKNLINEH